jgi:hypothetical protein
MRERQKMIARWNFLALSSVLLIFGGCGRPVETPSAEGAQASNLKVEDIPVRLGETTVTLRKTTKGPTPSYCLIVLHDNENTASCAARRYLETSEQGGVLLELIHDGSRYVSFTTKAGTQLRFDPNRIFTDRGLHATLRDENPGKAEAAEPAIVGEVKKLEQAISHQLAPFAVIIAVHNNTDNRFSVASYEIASSAPAAPNEAGRGNTRKIDGSNPAYAATDDPLAKDIDNFILVTNAGDFKKLTGKYNIILQTESGDSTAGQGVGPYDDGSLSIRLKSKRYFNIEVQHQLVTIDKKCGDAPCEVGVCPRACCPQDRAQGVDEDRLLGLQMKMIAEVVRVITNGN